jgi:hypothetical protein
MVIYGMSIRLVLARFTRERVPTIEHATLSHYKIVGYYKIVGGDP